MNSIQRVHSANRPLLALVHALRLHEGRARHPGGNFHHVYNLLRAMAPMAEARGWQLRVLVDEDGRRDLASLLPEGQMCCMGRRRSLVSEDLWIGIKVMELRPDIYYRPTGQLPFIPLNCAELMGVADLNFRWLKTSRLKRIYKELSYSLSLLRASSVVCISAFTRDDVARRFFMPKGRLYVISHGTNKLPVGGQPSWMSGVERFWVTFGHQPHKNVETILVAMSVSSSRETLVVIGQSEHVECVLKPLVAKLRLAGRVIFPGRITAEHLGWLYRHAIGLLFISRFEGFGLPVLEAMQLGCPVIGSNIPPVREVGGDAMEFVNVSDHHRLAEKMLDYMCSPEVRAIRSRAGVERAAQFSWEHAANATYDLWDMHMQFADQSLI